MNLISHNQIKKSLNKRSTCYALVAREVEPETEMQIPGHIKSKLEDFFEVLPKDLLGELLPMRDVQYAIDLVSVATLPNLPRYRMNPVKHTELQWQVEELLDKGFIKKSLSHVRFPHFWR